ncbi:hypothetical protein GIW81_05460 [Hyphomicrobium sp. xq]|uniref:Uncharacterized protein n=1 Tax=Hyphomicrobium album TaxID=2665159 RepID=A0A6I3KHL0_9HYPH|nr:hypothetical protein [Hyphomicrobium album]MTD93779.1 hypothetical protein [Hyphomicrobium album]
MRRTVLALLVLASAAILNGPATQAAAPSRCWKAPQAQTVQEAVIAAQNQAKLAARAKSAEPAAMLALSDGRLKSAYGAGLLVGWGETGTRPDFAVITAVGMSALLAPFAFLGGEGDGAIADIFACDASSLQEMAGRAASYLDANLVEKIARRHESGARLLVALPGSAARRETVWDLGAIAASRHPEARRQIGAILRAAVDLTTFIDPEAMPVSGGLAAVRNPALRRVGAGEPFLSAPSLRKPAAATYLIHNGVLFPDEGEQYAAAHALQSDPARTDIWLVPAYDLFTAAQRWQSPMLIASPRPYLNIQPQQSAFDLGYMRALFLDAYRQGRMRREWRSKFIESEPR